MMLQPTVSPASLASLAAVRDIAGLQAWRARASGRRVSLEGLAAALRSHPELSDPFFTALPWLARRAADLAVAAPGGVPLLLPGQAGVIELPRAAVAGLGVHLLLGTLPPVRTLHPAMPENRLDRALAEPVPSTGARLAAWVQWLTDAALAPPPGRLRVERRVGRPPPAAWWRACEAPLAPLEVVPGAGIEDAHGCLQVDFANRFPGGGVLGHGNVQEELRFAMSPELLASTLLCAAMDEDEAILVHGAAQVARIEGYGGAARYAGRCEDPGPVAPDGTPQVEVLVLDALPFRDRGDLVGQLRAGIRLRELGKAWVGFQPDPARAPSPIATGNWGCGVFGGHLPLKAVLQWLAASAHGRPLRYHPYGDPRLGDLAGFVQAARGRTVGALWRRLDALEAEVHRHGWHPVGQGCGLPDGRSLYEALVG